MKILSARHQRLNRRAARDCTCWRRTIDELGRADRSRNLRELERVFGQTPLAVSVTSGEGLEEIWRVISSAARGDAA